MPSITPSKSTTTTCIARVPYLNSVPFFRGLSLEERFELVDCVPHALGVQAAAGEVAAGLLPLADYLRLTETFERRRLAHLVTLRGDGVQGFVAQFAGSFAAAVKPHPPASKLSVRHFEARTTRWHLPRCSDLKPVDLSFTEFVRLRTECRRRPA